MFKKAKSVKLSSLRFLCEKVPCFNTPRRSRNQQQRFLLWLLEQGTFYTQQ